MIGRSTGTTFCGVGWRWCFSTGLGASFGLGGVSGGEASGSRLTTSGAEGGGGLK